MTDVWLAQCRLESEVALYWYGVWVAIKEKPEVAVWEGHEGKIAGLMSRSFMRWMVEGGHDGVSC